MDLKREIDDAESKLQQPGEVCQAFYLSAGQPRKTLFTIVGPRKRPVVLEDQGIDLLLVGNFALSTNEKMCRDVKLKRRALSVWPRLPAMAAFCHFWSCSVFGSAAGHYQVEENGLFETNIRLKLRSRIKAALVGTTLRNSHPDAHYRSFDCGK